MEKTSKKRQPSQRYRVEGIGKRGMVRYVKVVGSPGLWRITGLGGLKIEVSGKTVNEAVKIARRKIPFRPIVIRPMEETA
jgi:hypothetical protein